MTNEKMSKGEWLEVNGFSHRGETYVVMGKSFAIKDELKENNFKFSPLLRWHAPTKDYVLPEDCSYLELRYEDFFCWDDEQKISFLREGAREKLDSIFNPPRESNSEYQGAVGDALSINCRVLNVGGYRGAYGYTWIYVFEDLKGNEYTWFTTTNKSLTVGRICNVAGKVKAHQEYKGVKTTVLTRCIINSLDEDL